MIKKIALLDPAAELLTVYSLFISPRLGLSVLASLLAQHGYTADIFCDRVRKPKKKDLLEYDLVGISGLTNSINKAYDYAKYLKQHNRPVVMGGPHVTFMADEALQHCDYVVRGEGEETLLELLEALNQGQSLDGIKGLSYRQDGITTHNPDREFKDIYLDHPLDFTRVRGLEALKRSTLRKHAYLPTVYTSRGCPFSCEYCAVVKVAGRKIRYRDVDLCIEDIKNVTRGVDVLRTIWIVDDNFTVNMDRAKEIVSKIINLGLPDRFAFTLQLRVEAFRDEELLTLLNRARFGQIHVGFESLSPASLKEWGKKQNLDDIKFTLSQARKFGLKICGMFVAGSDVDTEESIMETVDFAIDSEITTMQLFAVTPLPGTDLYARLSAEGRIFNHDWKYYDCLHPVFFPARMKPSTLQKALIKANRKFYAYRRVFFNTVGNRTTYGIGTYLTEKSLRDYARAVRRQEEGFYSPQGMLDRDKLKTADGLLFPPLNFQNA